MRVAPLEGGGVLRLIITQNDVTARHESECRSREQAELLDAVGAAIIASDLDGLITHWSDGAERLYGWQAVETWVDRSGRSPRFPRSTA